MQLCPFFHKPRFRPFLTLDKIIFLPFFHPSFHPTLPSSLSSFPFLTSVWIVSSCSSSLLTYLFLSCYSFYSLPVYYLLLSFFSLPSCPFHSPLPSSLPHLPTLLIKPVFLYSFTPLQLNPFPTFFPSFLPPTLFNLPSSFIPNSLPNPFSFVLFHITISYPLSYLPPFLPSFHLSLFHFSLCFSLNLSFLSYLSLLPTFLSFFQPFLHAYFISPFLISPFSPYFIPSSSLPSSFPSQNPLHTVPPFISLLSPNSLLLLLSSTQSPSPLPPTNPPTHPPLPPHSFPPSTGVALLKQNI